MIALTFINSTDVSHILPNNKIKVIPKEFENTKGIFLI